MYDEFDRLSETMLAACGWFDENVCCGVLRVRTCVFSVIKNASVTVRRKNEELQWCCLCIC